MRRHQTRRCCRRPRTMSEASPHVSTDDGWCDRRHDSVHVAGAGGRKRDRWAQRHLFVGRGAVRNGDWQTRFRGEEPVERGERDPGERARPSQQSEADDPGGIGSNHSEMPGEKARRTMAECERPGNPVELDDGCERVSRCRQAVQGRAPKQFSKVIWLLSGVMALLILGVGWAWMNRAERPRRSG